MSPRGIREWSHYRARFRAGRLVATNLPAHAKRRELEEAVNALDRDSGEFTSPFRTPVGTAL